MQLLKFEIMKILEQKIIYFVFISLVGITLYNVDLASGPMNIIAVINPEVTGVMLLIGLSTIFTREYTSGVDNYILSSKTGKKELIWAKVGATLIYTFLVVFMFEIVNVAVNIWEFGVEGWGEGLQSFPPFAGSPYSLNMLEFHLIQLGIHFLGACGLALMIVLISSTSKNSLITFIISTVIFVGPILEFVDNIAIPWILALLPFVFYNIMQVQSYFVEFNAVNILGQSISYPVFASLLMIILSSIFIMAIFRIIKYKQITS
jgi:hypothetical protein